MAGFGICFTYISSYLQTQVIIVSFYLTFLVNNLIKCTFLSRMHIDCSKIFNGRFMKL